MSDEQEEPKTLRPDSGPDRDKMAGDYLPEPDDWLAKTQLDINDPHAIAGIQRLTFMYPELTGEEEELKQNIEGFTEDFLKGRTSVAGDSRAEYKDIIMAMFGASPDEKSTGEAFAEFLGAADDDE